MGRGGEPWLQISCPLFISYPLHYKTIRLLSLSGRIFVNGWTLGNCGDPWFSSVWEPLHYENNHNIVFIGMDLRKWMAELCPEWIVKGHTLFTSTKVRELCGAMIAHALSLVREWKHFKNNSLYLDLILQAGGSGVLGKIDWAFAVRPMAQNRHVSVCQERLKKKGVERYLDRT